MKHLITTISLLLLAFSNASIAQSDCLLNQNRPNSLVYDQADILSDSEEKTLAKKLVDFDNKTTSQIMVVTVTDLCGYDYASFSYELGEKWGVGDAKFDNGILLMVKPTGGQGQRHTFIATGYGLEAVIPDAIAKRIVEVEMIPSFKNNDFIGGINKATDVLMSLALKEFPASEYVEQTKKPFPFIPALFLIAIIAFVFFTRVNSVRRSAVGKDLSFWAALWLLSNQRHRSGGGWSNFNSGSGNFGGGGFGGFGGGSFGGGGAGGSW